MAFFSSSYTCHTYSLLPFRYYYHYWYWYTLIDLITATLPHAIPTTPINWIIINWWILIDIITSFSMIIFDRLVAGWSDLDWLSVSGLSDCHTRLAGGWASGWWGWSLPITADYHSSLTSLIIVSSTTEWPIPCHAAWGWDREKVR